MLGLLKKSSQPNSLAAVCPSHEGVALACIRRDRDLSPVLEACSFQPRTAGRADDKLLQKLGSDFHLDRMNCVSVMELGSYNLLMVEAPDVQPEELRAAIRWKIKDLIDFHIDDAVVDVFEVPDSKSMGRNRMMYAVVSRMASVQTRVDQLLNAGLNLSVIDIPELALRNLASLIPEDVGGVAMVYIEQDRGVITITRQSTLYLSRRIDKGYSSLPGGAMQQDDPELVQDWLDGIIVEIQRSLDYYESHFAKPQVSSIVITPLPREIPGIASYISTQLDIPARMLDFNSLLDVQSPVEPAMQSRCVLAIGAALRQERAAL